MIFRLIILMVAVSAGNAIPVSEYEEIYPERIHPTRHKRDLSTETEGYHDDIVTYKVKDLMLDLKRSEKIHPGSILVRSYDDNGNSKHEKKTPQDCYYHGKIRGVKDSNVHLSTCDGLRGVIDDGIRIKDIEPLNKNGLHSFYDVEREIKEIHELLNSGPTGDAVPISTKDSNNEAVLKNNQNNDYMTDYSLYNVEPQYIPYLVNPKRTRYVEMFVSVDHGLNSHYNGSTKKIIERVLAVFTQLDKAYQAINVRIVVVAIEIQNTAKFTRYNTGGADLDSFRDYWNNVIKKTSDFKDIRMDNAQLLSHYSWTDCVGMAYGGTLCGESSAAVDAWSYKSYSITAEIIGHEFGHNMNFPHDEGSCTCLTSKGCFMGGHKTSMPGFSNCSLNHLREREFACINDYPKHSLSVTCGNGIKENGEECDCGTEQNCIQKNDTCCQPHSCKLKPHVQCSHVNNPGCCSAQCLFNKKGKLCRESNGNCDTPEYCPGDSAECPVDLSRSNGQPCSESAAVLVGPMKRNGLSTKKFDTPPTARYLKIVPKYWKSGSYACTKLELFGCPTNADLTGVPTGISTVGLYYHGAMCITPDITSCDGDIPDGTRLMYRSMPYRDCNHPYMLFKLQADGTLIHHCSGKKVCNLNDTNLVLSSQCKESLSKFERTQKYSLKQKASGKCLMSTGNWPKSGSFIALRSVCDDTSYNRTRLHFLTQDCETNLGIGNHILKDSAFTASSEHSEKHNSSSLRFGDDGWCPKSKTDPSWIQVDLGQERRIKYLKLKGIYWNWINGYNLKYSSDGTTWHTYQEVGDEKQRTDSSCYKGKCILTYDHQCRGLWNADATKAPDVCWTELNGKANAYGTCNPTSQTLCTNENLLCGQIQCLASGDRPHYINYANPKHLTPYKKLNISNTICSGASIVGNDQVGLGMVADGTKCGDGKVCKDQQCKTLAGHNFPACKVVNGKICNGKGICRIDGTCQCEGHYKPQDGCATEFTPVNGGWKEWSEWSTCSHGCNGGTQFRYRYCNEPSPKYSGVDCTGDRLEKQACNTDACPIARSCRALKIAMEKLNKPLYDGVYTIKPNSGLTLKVYCDMKRHGGGWTLIVSSHSNNWTEENVYLRNFDRPTTREDYSILKHADSLKDSYLVKDNTFEYMLEANEKDRWGGIWKAPSYYKMASTNNALNNVKLIKRFDDWITSSRTISNRLPYVNKHALTTSPYGSSRNQYGSITDNKPIVHPSFWIYGTLKLEKPEQIWYWMREGEYGLPKTCFDIKRRGLNLNKEFHLKNYQIEPTPGVSVSTQCEMKRHGGGWTLLVKSSTKNGWTKDNSGLRNINKPESSDYSIFDYADNIKQQDSSEETFDYMIEANGDDQNGGIFSFSVQPSLSTWPQKNFKPILMKKFGSWVEANENIAKSPMFKTSLNGVFLKAGASESNDLFGALISVDSNSKYMTSLEQPNYVKVWMREGGSRKSCNDIAIHGYHKGVPSYKDGFYMLHNSQLVYCDMTLTPNEGWTLLVTSVSKGWTRGLVLSRNSSNPSLDKDYSILSQANSIKDLSNGNTFKYMLDANERHRWGGIYEAPISYKFNYTTENHPTTRLIQWDKWSDIWWKGIPSRMPWLGDPSHKRALLTTSGSDESYESGTICADKSEYVPARWIYSEMISPGVIWYWMNENDCDADHKQINGQYTDWSMWTQCTLCGSGKQSRERLCSDPKPRCGGNPCDSTVNTREERSCTGKCPMTRIVDFSQNYCFEPKSGGCSPVDGTRIVLRPTSSYCQDNSSMFVYDPETGVLHHPCSGKQVCVTGSVTYYDRLVVTSNCPDYSLSRAMFRTIWGSVQYGGSYCLDPLGGGIGNNVEIILYSNCMQKQKRFTFQNIDAPSAVSVAVYDLSLTSNTVVELKANPGYPAGSSIVGKTDNFFSASDIKNNYQLRLSAYFIAPMSGSYRFVAACDDKCDVSISIEPGKPKKIISITSNSRGRFKWNSNSVSNVELKVGKKYFLEGILIELGGGDYISVGVYLPDGTSLLPITSHYLTQNAD